MVIALIARNSKSARKWALGASISFITPQAYILISAQHAPTEVYRIVIGVIASLFAFTLLSLFLDLKRKSRQQ